MFKFSAKTEELKKAFGIAALAVDDKENAVESHSLFKITCSPEVKVLDLYSTDKQKMAYYSMPINTDESTSIEFTADPKKILSLLGSSPSDIISFSYNSETRTLNIYASEQNSSYLSFPSFEPEKFLSFENELNKAQELKTVNAELFLTGLRFVQGFLPSDTKDTKFTRIYLSKGIMYGSNGSNQIGAFESPDLSNIDDLIFPKAILSSAVLMIERGAIADIIIKTTTKFILLYSADSKCMLGFVRVLDLTPKFPITIEEPKFDAFNVDRSLLLKKLNRLAIATGSDAGIQMNLDTDKIEMKTLTERPSIESTPYTRKQGTGSLSFIIEHKIFKNILSLFQTPVIDIYVENTRCTLRNAGNVDISDQLQKPFVAVGLLSLPRML